ncbi:putative ensconsin-like [Cocos nucifera]|nr:putative ensconsin-like [Cocos nucifera]
MVLDMIEKILRMDTQERKKDSFIAFLKLGHHLFANVQAISLHEVEALKVMKEAKDAKAEVGRLKDALKENSTEVEHLN